MKQHLAKRVHSLKPSSVFELLQRAKKLKQQGKDIVSLSIGEPEWGTFDNIKEAAISAIKENYTKYTPASGREELRKKISERASEDFGIPVEIPNVTVSAGCKYALFTIFQCLCDPEDQVILPAPYWVSYTNIIELSGGKVHLVSTDESSGFKITAPQLEKAINKNTKFFLLNSPNNPTSAVYSKEELIALGKVLEKHPQIFIVTDDIYDRLVFDEEKAPHLLTFCPSLKDRVFAVNGGSKNYLMTGWRISWIVGPESFIKVFSSFQSQSISCANSITQRALELTLLNSKKEQLEFKNQLKDLRDDFFMKMKKIPKIKPYPSAGGFYLWVNVKSLIGLHCKGQKITSSLDLMEKLLENASLLCLSGEEFGAPGYLRFNYALKKETLDKAVLRLSQFVSELT